MSGKRSRDKGLNFERKIANDFKSIGFEHAKRHLEFQVDEAFGVDLDNTGIFKVQCKRNKGYAPISKIFEVKAEGIPLLITKGDNLPAMVVMPWADLMKILKDIGEAYAECITANKLPHENS